MTPFGYDYHEIVDGICEENKIFVGFTRGDRLFNYSNTKKPEEHNPSAVTLFLTDPMEKIKRFRPDIWEKYEIEQQSLTFYANFLRVAISVPDDTFNIKLKTNKATKIIERVCDVFNLSLPKNVTVYSRGDPFALYVESRAIAGFNTTCLLEGLILNKILVEPRIFPDGANTEYTFFGQFPGVSHYVKDTADFSHTISNKTSMQPDQKMREKALTHYFGLTDGRASERAQRAIINAAI